MPAKRSVNKSSLSKDVNELKRSKPTNNSVEHEAAKLTSENQEKIFLLQREKALLLSKVKRAKKDLSEMRATLKDLEFKALQDPQKKENVFPEFSKHVEMWSKTVGFTLDEVTYAKENTREWHLKGNVEEVQFNLNIFCATNDLTKKGYVKSFTIECSEPCKQELQPWLHSNEGNIEQIFKVLKVYSELNKAREIGLNSCKEEFGPLMSISFDPSGETVIELGTNDFYYFQIKWKITPSIKHFAKVKNACRIACTEDGDKLIKANANLSIIKKRLSQSPIDVIQLLARAITSQDNHEK